MATKNLGRVGMKPQGEYNSEKAYEELDIVKSGGSSYVSRKSNNTSPLSETEDWMLIAEGASFEDLTPEQVQELQQPAIDAAQSVVAVVSEANTATLNANDAADNAQDAAIAALDAAANTAMRYNDSVETVATDVIRRVDKVTKIEQEYKETTLNIDRQPMTDAMVDGFIYIKRGNKYYINSDFALNREVYLSSYGLLGTGVLRKISTVFPNVTLSQVQALDSTATLDNSADWYILMLLMKILPVNSTIWLTGKYMIDKELTIRRSRITVKGIAYTYSNIHLHEKAPSINQVASGENAIAFRYGDGGTNIYAGQIKEVYFEDFDIVGINNQSTRTGHGVLVDIPESDMVFSHFKNVRVRGHGKCGFKHERGAMNEIYFDDCQMYGNFDTGFWLTGLPTSQTNLFGFKRCGFGSNGYVMRNGVHAKYDHNLDGIDYTKGGISIYNMSACHFDSLNTQSNNGFGFMTREGASLRGITISSAYSEANPLGDYVMFALLSSSISIESTTLYRVIIDGEPFPNVNHFSVFKTEEHYRRFVFNAGIDYNRELHKRPWSNNLIPDAKNNVLDVAAIPSGTTTSRDSMGYLVRTFTKLKSDATMSTFYFTTEGLDKLKGLKKGDLINLSFDFKLDNVDPLDVAAAGWIEFGVLGYDTSPYPNFFNNKAVGKPTADGTWVRIRYTYTATGTESQTGNRSAFIRLHGNSLLGSQLTFSIRKTALRLQTESGFFQEPAVNATPLYKGIVNQAAAVANVAATDATDLATALTLVNELKSKLNAKLGADRTAGQQAT